MKNGSVLVIFTEKIPRKAQEWWRQFDVVVAPRRLESMVQGYRLVFVDIENLTEPGSIYEASSFLEELSYLKLADGSRLAKSFTYEGYELWWTHYSDLFFYFCLPYTQYKKLLEYLKVFQGVYFYRPPYRSLFSCYLRAYGCEINILSKPGIKSPSFLPFGVILQIFITFLCLPILMIQKRRVMLFTGDKFEKDKDYDFRMKFIYEELREKDIPFVEFIRSLESWRTILEHAWKRRRAVIYPEAVAFVGRFASILSGGHALARQKFGAHTFVSEKNPEVLFKLSVATQYLLGVYDDIWAVRIMKWILRVIGVKVAIVTAAMERNFHAVLGCKLNAIPTVGILHGAHSRHYNVYDFMLGFDGEKMLSVDKYGLWSEWWQSHFREYSRAYKPEQLYISGPMRPLLKSDGVKTFSEAPRGPVRVLFVSEEMAVPREVLPYLHELLKQKNIELTIKFRPYRDGFEQWLLEHEPGILKQNNLTIIKGSMQDAIRNADVTVGCQSTGVLESLLQLKVPIYFRTRKWGDYYNLKEYDKKHSFFAENPEELIEKIQNVRSVPINTLKDLRERYFGDPYQNGSKWVVEQAEKILRRTP